ncbi:MAG TPA: cytochrome P460 family protein [Bryobacteraceae bacterium]|nr:cytochrome P460 family protein [Bryobacteraceae bacterium]
MKRGVVGIAGVAAILAVFLMEAADRTVTDGPQFTAEGQLVRPNNYREWVYLSSGLGMVYGPAAEGASDAAPPFDNVFVNPAAYKAFMATGKWPDQTIFVLEIRTSGSKASINNGGRFQTGLVGIEAEVKDEKRFPGKWAFFGFGMSASPARMLPTTAQCYSCHSANGAVDNTFVQFYPTLLEVAKSKGTLNAKYAQAEGAEEQVVDVVCKMAIDPKHALKTEYKGKTYYFCQQDCKDNFESSPETYVSAGK